MRFAYIDSQGKEVGIPSVEALGLRIELGAITPSTDLYDASADRWAPASEHDVFRTLSREIDEKSEGFVAPPPTPPPATPPPSESPADVSSPPERQRAPNPFEALEGPGGEGAVPDAGVGGPEEPSGEGAFDLGVDLTLAGEEDEGDGDEAPDEGAFDFADLEALEVQGSSLADTGGDDAAAFSGDSLETEDVFSASYGGEDTGSSAPAGDGVADDPGSLGEIPSAADLPPSGGPASLWDKEEDEDGDAPMPAWARSAESPPELDADAEEALLRQQAEERRAAARARFDDGGVDDAGGGQPPGERTPRARPARSVPGPRRAHSAVAAGIVWGILLLVVAGGAWFGWSLLRGRSASDALPEAVLIPPIAAELEAPYRRLADAALATTTSALVSLADERGVPAEPPPGWLSGEYMANAGAFAEVPLYFEALRGYLGAARAADSTTFVTAFAAALDPAALAPAATPLLVRRAAAGFSATGVERRAAYAAFEDVLDAAISLHDFLVLNEDQIEYAPAEGGMSRDPVLEAVPSSPAIGDEMWARVDGITAALDALGALDRVTTERLVGLLTQRVTDAGVR